MQDKRKSQRFPLVLDAKFSSRDIVGAEHECRVVDVCDEGLAAMLCLSDAPDMSRDHHLRINIQNSSVNFVVRLQWVKKLELHQDYNFLAGFRFVSFKPEEKEAILQLGRRHFCSARQDHQHDSPAPQK